LSNFKQLKHKIYYFSGYIAILFGRSRSSEDIDLLMEKITFSKFKELWNNLSLSFECLNTSVMEEAYSSYISSNIPIRFAKFDTFEPNIEIKFPKTELYERKLIIGKILSFHR